MKHYFTILAALCIISFYACDNDDEDASIYEYHAHIHHPDTTSRSIGDTLEIEIEFESHTGQPVHHINVRIFNKANLTEIYNKPNDAYIDDSSGAYTFEDHIILSKMNGLTEGDWVLEAKVWGEKDGQEVTSASVEFRLHE